MNVKFFTLSLLASAIFAGIGVTPAMAQSTPRIDQSQAEISARIQQGINSGHITAQEAPALIAREREIARQEARIKADGRATPVERQRLREDLTALRAEVEQKMNNRVVAIPANPPASANSTPGIDQSQAAIRGRIQQGITSGHITAQEAPDLLQRERELARQEARIKADGRATPQERQRLRGDLAALRVEVEEKMNNRVVAFPVNPPASANNTPGIDRSQAAISARIQQGVTSGHITAQEAPALIQRERELVRQEARIKADGRATPQERQRLREDLAALRNEVERKMANNVVTAPPGAQTPGIDNIGEQIRARIEQGIRSGRISRGESRILYQRERDIERREVRFKADGVVSSRERRRLQRELSSLSQDVERMIANNRRDRNRS